MLDAGIMDDFSLSKEEEEETVLISRFVEVYVRFQCGFTHQVSLGSGDVVSHGRSLIRIIVVCCLSPPSDDPHKKKS